MKFAMGAMGRQGIPDPFYYGQLQFLITAFIVAGTAVNDQYGHPYSVMVWYLISVEELCLHSL